MKLKNIAGYPHLQPFPKRSPHPSVNTYCWASPGAGPSARARAGKVARQTVCALLGLNLVADKDTQAVSGQFHEYSEGFTEEETIRVRGKISWEKCLSGCRLVSTWGRVPGLVGETYRRRV